MENRTGGHAPISVERPALNYKFAEAAEVVETGIILGLDDEDLTTSTQTDVIDFDTVTNDIDLFLIVFVCV